MCLCVCVFAFQSDSVLGLCPWIVSCWMFGLLCIYSNQNVIAAVTHVLYELNESSNQCRVKGEDVFGIINELLLKLKVFSKS